MKKLIQDISEFFKTIWYIVKIVKDIREEIETGDLRTNEGLRNRLFDSCELLRKSIEENADFANERTDTEVNELVSYISKIKEKIQDKISELEKETNKKIGVAKEETGEVSKSLTEKIEELNEVLCETTNFLSEHKNPPQYNIGDKIPTEGGHDRVIGYRREFTENKEGIHFPSFKDVYTTKKSGDIEL